MEALREIERIVLARKRDVAKSALEGASEGDLELLSKTVGDLPDSLRALLSWKNGSPSDLWLGDDLWFLLSAKEIASTWNHWVRSENRFDHVWKRLGARRSGWPERMIPFATWNGDVFVVVDADPSGYGRVYGIDIEGQRTALVAESMDSFFSKALAALQHDQALDVDELMSADR